MVSPSLSGLLQLSRSARQQHLPRLAGGRRNDAYRRLRRQQGEGPHSLLPPQVTDPRPPDHTNGQPIAGAQVCIQAHTDLAGRLFHLVATTTTNQNGGWSYKTNRGPSRIFRIAYRYGASETSTDLALHIRSRSTLHLSTHRTPFHKKIFFSGELPGPLCAGRTAYVSGTVPGASRRFLVGQATTDALCHFRIGYAFLRIDVPARFVFWVNIPEQAGYPDRPGRSVNRYIQVLPHPPPKKAHRHHKKAPSKE